MSDLTDLLHRLAEAIHRPADHPLDELTAAVDALEGAPEEIKLHRRRPAPTQEELDAPKADTPKPMPDPDTAPAPRSAARPPRRVPAFRYSPNQIERQLDRIERR